MSKVGEVPEGRKPLLEVIIEELEARGFYRDPEKGGELGATFWTHDDWQNWWRDRVTGETYQRDHFLMDTVAQVIGEESGFSSITRQ